MKQQNGKTNAAAQDIVDDGDSASLPSEKRGRNPDSVAAPVPLDVPAEEKQKHSKMPTVGKNGDASTPAAEAAGAFTIGCVIETDNKKAKSPLLICGKEDDGFVLADETNTKLALHHTAEALRGYGYSVTSVVDINDITFSEPKHKIVSEEKDGKVEVKKVCAACDGTGKASNGDPCAACNNSGAGPTTAKPAARKQDKSKAAGTGAENDSDVCILSLGEVKDGRASINIVMGKQRLTLWIGLTAQGSTTATEG